MEQNIEIDYLLKEYNKENILKIKKFIFKGVENKDVYNITAPLKINDGEEHIAGRVESRESETNSKIMFFLKENEDENSKTYVVDKKAQILDLQDPFFCIINNELVLGGVEISSEEGGLNYRTGFYKGVDVFSLKRFAQGPNGMKDIRLIALEDKVCIFTRPQGVIGGRGRIGFITINSIEYLPELKDEQYFSATLLNHRVSDEVWLGANQVLLLKNGNLGILGHIANFSDRLKKNYYPIVFQFNIETKEVSKMKIIVRAQDLPERNSKSKELVNVLYPGGLVRLSNGEARLYVGARDAESYEITIKDPFLEYELT